VLDRASVVSKTFFIIPNDAHYYKITEMLKKFTSLKLLRHVSVHAGTIIREQSYTSLKLLIWFICARRYRRSQCYGGISACCASVGTTKSVFEALDLSACFSNYCHLHS